MKKFNRVLYAIISDMFEKLIANDPNISNDDIMQNMYQYLVSGTGLKILNNVSAQEIYIISDFC